MLYSQPLTSLKQTTQEQIRTALKPALEAIVRDPAMGLQDTKVDEVVLDAIPLTKGSDRALYAVSWNAKTFGVNGAIWLIEVTRDRATNLTPSSPEVFGFGIEVLPGTETVYPDLMIASKGFRSGGGAEAEEMCLKKTGPHYESVSCPSTCHQNLNEP